MPLRLSLKSLFTKKSEGNNIPSVSVPIKTSKSSMPLQKPSGYETHCSSVSPSEIKPIKSSFHPKTRMPAAEYTMYKELVTTLDIKLKRHVSFADKTNKSNSLQPTSDMKLKRHVSFAGRVRKNYVLQPDQDINSKSNVPLADKTRKGASLQSCNDASVNLSAEQENIYIPMSPAPAPSPAEDTYISMSPGPGKNTVDAISGAQPISENCTILRHFFPENSKESPVKNIVSNIMDISGKNHLNIPGHSNEKIHYNTSEAFKEEIHYSTISHLPPKDHANIIISFKSKSHYATLKIAAPENHYDVPRPVNSENHYDVPRPVNSENHYANSINANQKNHYDVPRPDNSENHYANFINTNQKNHYAIPRPVSPKKYHHNICGPSASEKMISKYDNLRVFSPEGTEAPEEEEIFGTFKGIGAVFSSVKDEKQ